MSSVVVPRTEIRSLSRGLMVLKAIRFLGSSRLQDICVATGLPKSTVKRILGTLISQGYVRRGLGDDLYRLSAESENLSVRLSYSDKIAAVAAPYLDQLCARVAWPSDIAVYSDGVMEIGETTRRLTPLLINRLATAPLIHIPISALGRAYLAYCQESECTKILDKLKRSMSPYDRQARDDDAMGLIIEETRKKGYASRQPGYSVTPPETEFNVQLSSIAVPVLGSESVLACINIVWIVGALSEDQIVSAYLNNLQDTAEQIAKAYSLRYPNAG